MRAYLVAVGTTVAAIAGRAALDPLLGDRASYVLLYPVVVLLAWHGGVGPTLVSLALGVAAGLAQHPATPGVPGDAAYRWVSHASFVASGLLAALLAQRVRAGRRVAEAGAGLLREQRDEIARESALRRDAERLARESLESMGDAYCRFDSGLRYVDCNARHEQLTGRGRAELVGRLVWDVWPAAETGARAEVERAARERVPVELLTHYVPHGSWYSVRVFPTADGGVAVFSSDATESIRARQLLEAKERQLQAITESSAVMLVQCSRDLRYVFVNRAAEQFLGRPRAEIVGRPIASVVGGAAFEAIRPYVERVLAGETVEYEAEVPYQRSGRRFVSVRYVPDRAASGEVEGWFASVADVTFRKVAELAVQRSADEAEARLRELQAIYDTAPVGLCLLDSELRFVRINDRLAEMNGRPAAEHLGRTVRELVPQLADAAEPVFRRVLETGEAVTDFELRGETAADPGVEHVWLESYFPLHGPDGRVAGVNLVAQDITRLKRAEVELREADRRKDEFLATLGHELRNPLAPIANAAELLRLCQLGDSRARAARDVIERQTRRMARLIDDLLDTSRIASGKLALRRARVALRDVVEEVVETVRPLLDAKRQLLLVELPREPVVLDADPARLAQVFANLLSNAHKFSPANARIALGASLSPGPGQGTLRVSVRDDGKGIDPGFLPRVFEPFAQSQPALERTEQGLGLGLSLVRAIVELHGGHVSARSEGPGRGSEFVVELPLAQPPQATAAAVAPAAPAPSGGASERLGRPRRILVVDDNGDSAESLAVLLRLLGHEVHIAEDGAAAVASAERHRPEGILMDIGLPVLNGYDACRSIRSKPWGREVLLVAQTGWGQEADVRRAMEAGFDDHLVKPVDPGALARILGAPRR